MTAPLPIGYRDSSLSIEFLRGQFHRFVHLRWSFADLHDFASSSEELLARRHSPNRVLGFCGFTFVRNGRYLINPGSIGQRIRKAGLPELLAERLAFGA
jgi:hypothetical protein